MSNQTISATTSANVTVTVSHNAVMVDKRADGDIVSSELMSVANSIILTMGDKIIAQSFANNAIQYTYPGMSPNAVAVIVGTGTTGGEKVQPIGQATLDLILSLQAEAKLQAEAEFEVVDTGLEDVRFVILEENDDFSPAMIVTEFAENHYDDALQTD